MAPPPQVNDESDNQKSERSKKGDDIYMSAARTIARCVDLWCDPDKVFKTMRLIQLESASQLGELDEDDDERNARKEALDKISLESREFATCAYYRLIQMIPTLKETFEDPRKSQELADICTKMTTEIKGTRSSDATHLKSSIPRYCQPNVNDPTSLPTPVPNGRGRAQLGLNHPILARWLCPVEKLDVFDKDPEQARKDLASGDIPMVAEDFPALFWSGDLPGGDYDPEDMLQGLFQSYFLVRIARHIFLGPSFAVEAPDRKNWLNNAVLNDVTMIEAEHIAYACLQARFGISSRDTWSEQDGTFNYLNMYRGIIQFIKKGMDTAWGQDLLHWWNKEVFGNENGRDGGKKVASRGGNSTSRMTTMERLEAQMKARERREPPFPLDPALASESSSSASSMTAPPCPPPVPTTRTGCTTIPPSPVEHTPAPNTVPGMATSSSGGMTGLHRPPAPTTRTAVSNIRAVAGSSGSTPRPSTPIQAAPAEDTGSPLTCSEPDILSPVTNQGEKQPASAPLLETSCKRLAPGDEEGTTGTGGRGKRKSKRARTTGK